MRLIVIVLSIASFVLGAYICDTTELKQTGVALAFVGVVAAIWVFLTHFYQDAADSNEEESA